MTGLLLFALGFAGFGKFLPDIAYSRQNFSGFRFFGGGLLFVFTFFLLHVILHIDLTVSVWLVLALSLIGITLTVRDHLIPSDKFWRECMHPVPVMILVGALGIQWQGGIGYLPYSGDEFSNWLGVSREIFMAGDYGQISDKIWLQGYTPGWRLMLLIPWVFTGAVNEGNSAAAPFVLLIGLVGMVFDVVRWRLRLLPEMSDTRSDLFAWVLILVALSAELAGPTWMWNLLIEQPQIYTLAASAIALYLCSQNPENSVRLALYAGIALAGSYLFKSAGLSFVPAAGFALLCQLRFRSGMAATLRQLASLGIPCFAPTILILLMWTFYTRFFPPNHMSVLATLTPDYIAHAASLDWPDLANRFSRAVGTYLLEYKFPLTPLFILTLLIAAIRGQFVPLVLWLTFFTTYMFALYWYHLGIFGPYYFENLNSVERFTRIPVQTLHVLGFVVAIFQISELLARPPMAFISAILRGKTVIYCSLLAIAGLGSFQVLQISRSIVDVSSRRFQNIDPYINDVRHAVAAARQLAGGPLPEDPRVLLIAQNAENTPLVYALYFAIGLTGPSGSPLRIHFDGVSWTAGPPVNVWQEKITPDRMRRKLLSNDLIWPLRVDPWILSILSPLTDNSACLDKPLAHYFVRQPKENGDVGFKCEAKSGMPEP